MTVCVQPRLCQRRLFHTRLLEPSSWGCAATSASACAQLDASALSVGSEWLIAAHKLYGGAFDTCCVLRMQTAYRLVGMDLLPWTDSDQTDYQNAFMSLLVRFKSASLLDKSSAVVSDHCCAWQFELSCCESAAAGILIERCFATAGLVVLRCPDVVRRFGGAILVLVPSSHDRSPRPL